MAARYHFTGVRKGKWPREHLKHFEGWLHADGYAGFEGLYRGGRIREVACLAHVRRKFFDIHLAQGSAIAKEALERIAELYQIEEAVRGKPPDERQRVRQEHATPRLDNLEHWLRIQLTRISGKSALADAIRYGLSRLQRLRPYLDDGRLAIDNNPAERGMRGIAVGRKNSYDHCQCTIRNKAGQTRRERTWPARHRNWRRTRVRVESTVAQTLVRGLATPW